MEAKTGDKVPSLFTKRHHAVIATMLRDTGTPALACLDWADYLATDNPRFDRARFLQTCEIGTE